MSTPLATPFKDVLPPLSSEEYRALSASIAKDGVRVPIDVDEVGNILDGHHRHSIDPGCPRRVVRGLTEAEKLARVLTSNLHRRNFSPDQKAELRKRQIGVAQALRAEGKAQTEIGKVLEVDQGTVSRWLGHNMQAHNVSDKDRRVKVQHEDREDALRRIDAGEAQAQIAADLGITDRHLARIHYDERKRAAREAEIVALREAIASGEVKAGDAPYDVVVVDPPWPYGNADNYNPRGFRATTPYPEMTLEEIAGWVPEHVEFADDSILWLWTTHRFLPDAFPLITKWGFDQKVTVTWAKTDRTGEKPRFGVGRWLRSASEFCIMAVKGSPQVKLTNQSTIIHGPMRQHSRKPDEFYEMVEGLCVGPRRADVFSREARSGWDQIGVEPNRFAA